MSTEPTQVPHADGIKDPAAPGFVLYDANAVSLATFFGTPAAGGCLMFLNERRLGRTARGILLLAATVLVTGLAMFIGWNMPPTGAFAIGIALLLMMRPVATALESKDVAAHVARAGRLGSKWTAFWISLVFLAVYLNVAYELLVKPTSKAEQGSKIIIGTKDEVFYTGLAAKSEAIALGNDLKTDGYFADNGVTVVLDKDAGGPTVSFIVKDGGWNAPSAMHAFEELGREVAPEVGGFPVRVRLVNKNREVKKESVVGRVLFTGGDSVYYEGAATSSEAQALGKALTTSGFFGGKQIDVFLTKNEDGTALSFVVTDGAWNDATMVQALEQTTRLGAATVGGLPVRMRLMNQNLEVKKDELLK